MEFSIEENKNQQVLTNNEQNHGNAEEQSVSGNESDTRQRRRAKPRKEEREKEQEQKVMEKVNQILQRARSD